MVEGRFVEFGVASLRFGAEGLALEFRSLAR